MERKNIFYKIHQRFASFREKITRREMVIAGLMILLGILIGVLISLDRKKDRAEDVAHEHVAEEEGETIWTCAMHPQIRQNEPGLCPICGMDLTPLEKTGGTESAIQMEMTEAAIKLANIQTVAVTAGEAEKEIFLTGKVEVSEKRIAEIPAHFHGRIERLYVDFTGEYIAQGEVLASVYSPELIAAQKELLEAYKMRETDPELYRAARAKLRLWKFTEQQVDNIIRSGNIQTTLDIISHVSGIVLKRNIELGDHVRMGDVLYKIANLDVVWLMFDAYENDLPWIEVGNRMKFTVPSMPGEVFFGKVSFIDPVIDSATRTASVRVEATNKNGKLKPQMFARGFLFASPEAAKNNLTVPKSAVLWTGTRSVVYVRVPGTVIPTFEFREIVLGVELEDSYLVEEGLAYGDEVVVNGAFTIDAAAQLNNKASMMNRQIAVKGQQIAVEEYTEDELLSFKEATPKEFLNQLNQLVNAYLNMKNALVENNAEASDKYAKVSRSTLGEADETLLERQALEFWQEKKGFLNNHLDIHLKEAGLPEKKENFVYISNIMIKLVEVFGAKQKLYVDHCPMALNNEGGYWLSEIEAIKNPFMPEKMLSCGEVIKVIEPE